MAQGLHKENKAQNSPLVIAIDALTRIQTLCAKESSHDSIWEEAEKAIQKAKQRH